MIRIAVIAVFLAGCAAPAKRADLRSLEARFAADKSEYSTIIAMLDGRLHSLEMTAKKSCIGQAASRETKEWRKRVIQAAAQKTKGISCNAYECLSRDDLIWILKARDASDSIANLTRKGLKK